MISKRTRSIPQGRKDDSGKLPWSLLPSDAVEEVVKVLGYGAKRYTERNWEKGVLYSRVFDAMMRHSWAWFRGENNDKDSGITHLAHAVCDGLFLLAYIKRKMTKFDDRPRKEAR